MIEKSAVRLAFVFLVFLLTPAPGMGFSRDITAIQAPEKFDVLDYEPVDIFIEFKQEPKKGSFRAWLNSRDISHLFTPVENGLKARVTLADGLRSFEEDERGSLHSRGMNFLVTAARAKKKNRRWDVDHRIFFLRTGTVETRRDDRGVWFITGSDKVSSHTVFKAMGYAVATDRLWQMELYRRQSMGRLAEIFGPGQLGTDIYLRTIAYSEEELARGVENLDKETSKVIKGYVAGINKRIEEIKADPSLLPVEFHYTTGLPPEKWTCKDILAWTALMQRNFDPEALDTAQIDNAALFQTLIQTYGPAKGAGMFNDLRWTNDPESQTYIVDGPASVPGRGRALEKTLERTGPGLSRTEYDAAVIAGAADKIKQRRKKVVEKLKEINAFIKMGSYAWAVSGEHTDTGNPMIYSGPQMGFSVPSIVTEGSIRAGGLDISGMTVPGIPGIIIGRTPHHAWSMQVGHAHTTDYYFENPEDVELHRMETIKVLGAEDVVIPVFRTVHGPVIHPMPYDPSAADPSPIISWKYAHWGYEFNSIEAFLDLARARNMDEFGKGIEKIGVSQHFCYADRDGNIAYWMSGRNPVRPAGEWRLPQGAAGPALEWDSAILMDRSTDRNPARGYYGGWNNKTRPDYDNAFNSTSDIYGVFHRSHVIYDYFDKAIAENKTLSFEEIRDLALDIATTDSFGNGGNPWQFVEGEFTSAVLGADEADPPEERLEALALLENWDGHFVEGGPDMWTAGPDRADAWVLMDAWIREVLKLTFEDELGDGQPRRVLFDVLLHGLAGEDSGIVNSYDWFQNADPSAPQTPEEIIVTALDNVLDRLGENPWGINLRGEIVYTHPILGQVHSHPFASRSTYAHCLEYGSEGPVRIQSMFPLGESGNILLDSSGFPVFDDHFRSMTPVFDNFVYRDFPLFDE
ncbi:penicillin acylase family protein [Desulfospira joergensenii]|uniref:penicillin acylase family protein n=1 Tax=Desulfospira joergensenii TaxID=53329 RepID=UPI0003B78C06|nr:penicillin acylase family protein [Desulfospira joergensenii]